MPLTKNERLQELYQNLRAINDPEDIGYKPHNSSNMSSLRMKEHFDFWHYLYATQDNELITAYYSYSGGGGALQCLANARALNKKDFIYAMLTYAEEKSMLNHVRSEDLMHFQHYWLWLALEESDVKLQNIYLKKYAQIYAIFTKRELKAHISYQLVTRCQIEENLAYALLKRPVPHTKIELRKEGIPNASVLNFYIQEIIQRANTQKLEKTSFNELTSFILTSKNPYASIALSQTVAFLVSHGLQQEAYKFLVTFFQKIANAKENIQDYNDSILKELERTLICNVMWIVRIGLLLKEDEYLLKKYIHDAEQILSTNSSESHGYRLTTLATMLENVVDPSGFKQFPTNSKSGEDMLHNACLLMNPHNPAYSPKGALTLLEQAIINTHQFGDTYLEYIRCKLLLDPEYSIDQDAFINEHFFKHDEHHGLGWVALTNKPHPFNNELALLKTLEKIIKINVRSMRQAYENPNNPETLRDYPIELFHTALGHPGNLLKLRETLYKPETHQKYVLRPVIHSVKPSSSYLEPRFLTIPEDDERDPKRSTDLSIKDLGALASSSIGYSLKKQKK